MLCYIIYRYNAYFLCWRDFISLPMNIITNSTEESTRRVSQEVRVEILSISTTPSTLIFFRKTISTNEQLWIAEEFIRTWQGTRAWITLSSKLCYDTHSGEHWLIACWAEACGLHDLRTCAPLPVNCRERITTLTYVYCPTNVHFYSLLIVNS